MKLIDFFENPPEEWVFNNKENILNLFESKSLTSNVLNENDETYNFIPREELLEEYNKDMVSMKGKAVCSSCALNRLKVNYMKIVREFLVKCYKILHNVNV